MGLVCKGSITGRGVVGKYPIGVCRDIITVMPYDDYQKLITFWLAIWGALLSTVLAIYSIQKARQDRAQIDVYVEIMVTIPATIPYLMIVITNRGRRPANITGVGFKTSRQKVKGVSRTWLMPELPHMLEKEGSTFQITRPLLAEQIDEMSAIKSLTVFDSHGRMWTAPRKVTRRLAMSLKDKNSTKKTYEPPPVRP